MIYLSSDQDWAPPWATLELCDRISARGLRGTLFVTNDCPSLPILKARDFELGWHPNFLPGSTHGTGIAEVLDTMAALVPDATGARAHCLIRGTPYLTAYRERGLRYDAADLHDGVAGLTAFESWTGVARLPIFFEDDVHIARGLPCTLETLELDRPGLQVFNFHPVLVGLNAKTPASYAALKADLARRGVPLTAATKADFAPFVEEAGVGDLLDSVVQLMAEQPHRAGGCLSEIL
jgi:hypothetical protein